MLQIWRPRKSPLRPGSGTTSRRARRDAKCWYIWIYTYSRYVVVFNGFRAHFMISQILFAVSSNLKRSSANFLPKIARWVKQKNILDLMSTLELKMEFSQSY